MVKQTEPCAFTKNLLENTIREDFQVSPLQNRTHSPKYSAGAWERPLTFFWHAHAEQTSPVTTLFSDKREPKPRTARYLQ